MKCHGLLVAVVLAVWSCAHVGVESENYRATLLFFEGGSGQIYSNNYDMLIARTQHKLMKEGFIVEYMPLYFKDHFDRLTTTHFQSIQKKVDSLRTHGHKHIWLMGISNGALSVMNAACNQISQVEGIIIVNPRHNIHMHLDFKAVDLPFLIITHKEDDSNLKQLTTEDMKRISPASPLADIVIFSGGHVGKGPQAEYLTQRWQHGLTGLEDEFVEVVSEFIGNNQK